MLLKAFPRTLSTGWRGKQQQEHSEQRHNTGPRHHLPCEGGVTCEVREKALLVVPGDAG